MKSRLDARKKLTLNTVTSAALEIVTIICGFILPRLILSAFGSETNGLVNSITHFLGFISFLNLGVGAVMQSAFYKPLAEKDNAGVSKVFVSGQKFFTKIGWILAFYVATLAAVYPLIGNGSFDYFDVALLVVAMSVNMFAQYFFGLADRLLLTADQKGYIQYTANIIALILNTAACAVLIMAGASIQIVKLTTSVIFLLQPLVLHLYVNRHYELNRRIKYEGEPIRQKWNGVAQHVAAVVWENTDVAVLTLCADYYSVSVYSVYYMVIGKIKNLVYSMSYGVMALLGEQWAKKETVRLKNTFARYEWTTGFVTSFTFGCTMMLVTPFIMVYTKGINDAEYLQNTFAILLTSAMIAYCIGLPYKSIIKAAGEYKKTQHIYIIAAALNVAVSVASVFAWGLIGVAIGTLVSMAYQTTAMAVFNHKYLVKGTLGLFVKQMSVDILTVALIYLSTFWIKLTVVSYLGWLLMAVEVAAIAFTVTAIVNIVFYSKHVFDLFGRILKKKRSTPARADDENACAVSGNMQVYGEMDVKFDGRLKTKLKKRGE